MLTDVGRVRATNEDTVMYVARPIGADAENGGFLALVADGMGGHAAGEVASALAADKVREVVYGHRDEAHATLRRAFEVANAAIRAHSAENQSAEGMGTTCTALMIRDNEAWLAHVGDSRAYLLREGALHQLSDDQTLHAQLIRDGLMTQEEAASAPGSNFILAALGARDSIDPTIWREGLSLQLHDRFVLCSDGLTSVVSDRIIAEALQAAPDVQTACRTLVDAALAAGAPDNVSVGVFLVAEPDEPKRKLSATASSIAIVPEAASDSRTVR